MEKWVVDDGRLMDKWLERQMMDRYRHGGMLG